MSIKELANLIEARVVFSGRMATDPIDHVVADNKISELLNAASSSTLLITSLSGLQLIRVASLMDAPGICLVNGVEPDQALITLAGEHNIGLIISPLGLQETYRRLAAGLGLTPKDSP